MWDPLLPMHARVQRGRGVGIGKRVRRRRKRAEGPTTTMETHQVRRQRPACNVRSVPVFPLSPRLPFRSSVSCQLLTTQNESPHVRRKCTHAGSLPSPPTHLDDTPRALLRITATAVTTTTATGVGWSGEERKQQPSERRARTPTQAHTLSESRVSLRNDARYHQARMLATKGWGGVGGGEARVNGVSLQRSGAPQLDQHERTDTPSLYIYGCSSCLPRPSLVALLLVSTPSPFPSRLLIIQQLTRSATSPPYPRPYQQLLSDCAPYTPRPPPRAAGSVASSSQFPPRTAMSVPATGRRSGGLPSRRR